MSYSVTVSFCYNANASLGFGMTPIDYTAVALVFRPSRVIEGKTTHFESFLGMDDSIRSFYRLPHSRGNFPMESSFWPPSPLGLHASPGLTNFFRFSDAKNPTFLLFRILPAFFFLLPLLLPFFPYPPFY